jgi:hypothetical protein
MGPERACDSATGVPKYGNYWMEQIINQQIKKECDSSPVVHLGAHAKQDMIVLSLGLPPPI